MDRTIFYPSSLPLAEDMLQIQRSAMEAVGALAQAIVGYTPALDGFGAAATGGLSFSVGPGAIFAPGVVDGSAFGVLPPQLTPLVKVGASVAETFPVTAPAPPGTSIVFLLQAAFNEVDSAPAVLDYYNAANPSQPFAGPLNSGQAQYTRRLGKCALQLKAGAVAPVGQAVAPAADAGWVPVYTVTVNAGAVAVQQSDLAEHPAAPFVRRRLTTRDADLSGFATTAALNAGLAALRPSIPDAVTFGAGPFSWQVPAGVHRVRIRAVAGGGGGTGAIPQSDGSLSSGAGGGAGGYAEGAFAVVPGQLLTGTVGAGGAGGAASLVNNEIHGVRGGDSAVNGLLSATGGDPGLWSTPFAASGGFGGVGSGGSFQTAGGDGGDGQLGDKFQSGTGGASFFGGGGRSGAHGANGRAPGSGGGAAYGGNGPGGRGADGVLLIDY